MKHVLSIEAFLETLVKSENFHALVVQSPPGWSKSTTIDAALKRLSLVFVAMGSYTTPLHFYNTLAEHPKATIVLDDCAGLFGEAKTMALLKAATWTSAGGNSTGARRIAWGSTSEKVTVPAFDFEGKIILLTNTLPQGKETQAFLSRCLNYEIAFNSLEIKRMILLAAESTEHFTDLALSKEVAQFLVSDHLEVDITQINLRTLRLGFELAKTQPHTWRELLPNLLPKSKNTSRGPIALGINPDLPVSEQQAEFRARTGLSRRSFFHYKKKLGLTRSYLPKSPRSRDKISDPRKSG